MGQARMNPRPTHDHQFGASISVAGSRSNSAG
jgi:hypothetical protein